MNVTLARILCQNADSVTKLQPSAFELPGKRLALIHYFYNLFNLYNLSIYRQPYQRCTFPNNNSIHEENSKYCKDCPGRGSKVEKTIIVWSISSTSDLEEQVGDVVMKPFSLLTLHRPRILFISIWKVINLIKIGMKLKLDSWWYIVQILAILIKSLIKQHQQSKW